MPHPDATLESGNVIRSIPRLPEMTLRSVVTGMVIGALLTPCNVYSGLKIGWTFNMSVAAGLLAFGFWNLSAQAGLTRPLRIHENNINQTTASSAASIISSGLAAPIPALALLTGQVLPYETLVVWLMAVSLLGVVVAAGLRNQLLFREHLPFPSGVATAETMREIHGAGKEAAQRVRLLFGTAGFAAALKTLASVFSLKPLAPGLKVFAGGRVESASLMNLGFALDPSVLMVGFGAISGLRIGVSALLGAVAGWGVLAPIALSNGWAEAGPDDPTASWFGPLVEWLLWPGATLMTVAALTAFGISVVRRLRRRLQHLKEREAPAIPPRFLLFGLAVALVFATAAQTAIFSIRLDHAVIAVLLSYVLAIVAARVSGETAITPIGALGKITQFSFGAIAPGNVTANLMSANVTGGAAGQCADLMHDLRTGQLIGATPRFQVIAQLFGVLTGSLAGAAAYLLMIPDPERQLLTPEWPAPAVATWKAVAEVLSSGFAAMPPGAFTAMLIAAFIGVTLALFEKFLPDDKARFVPSASAIGLAFVIPAWNSISLFLGAAIAAIVLKLYPEWGKRRLIVVAAGLIVGESLAGVAGAIGSIFG